MPTNICDQVSIIECHSMHQYSTSVYRPASPIGSMIYALNVFVFLPVRTEKISYLSPDWFSFDNHVLVGGGDKEVCK